MRSLDSSDRRGRVGILVSRLCQAGHPEHGYGPYQVARSARILVALRDRAAGKVADERSSVSGWQNIRRTTGVISRKVASCTREHSGPHFALFIEG